MMLKCTSVLFFGYNQPLINTTFYNLLQFCIDFKIRLKERRVSNKQQMLDI